MQPRMHADQDVVDDGLVLEDREVLEGAGNAKARQRMRRELGEIPPVKKGSGRRMAGTLR